MTQQIPHGGNDLVRTLSVQARQALAAGDYKDALASSLEAFTLLPADPTVQAQLIEILGCTSGYNLPKPIIDALTDAAVTGGHNVQAFATLLSNEFDSHAGVHLLIKFLEETTPGEIHNVPSDIEIQDILFDQLFLLVATKALVISPIVERLLVALRAHFLGEWLADTSSQSFFLDQYPEALAAVACQAFNSEYIYTVDPEDEAKIGSLEDSIMEDIRAAHPTEIAILSAYRPLWATMQSGSPEDLQYLIEQAPRWPSWVQLIWKTQFLGPCQESLISQQLPTLSPIEDDMSQKMSTQYKAFPYPRWQTTKTPKQAISLKAHLKARFPHFNTCTIADEPIDILFAGCGTGEQLVKMGAGLKTKNVLAIDLSKTSLAYAKRQTDTLGMKNIHFGQADILEVPHWNASFNLIVCTGVLHHMQDPNKGLKALIAASKPNSVFFLALYSERARTHVRAAHALIKQHEIDDNLEGMRRFRQMVRDLPEDHPVKPIANSREFYSASGLHDFVFNTHELRYTPLQVADLLDSHDLEFVGFDMAHPNQVSAYKTQFPEDSLMTNLENWDTFEQNNPSLFEAMMQFWCVRKPKN